MPKRGEITYVQVREACTGESVDGPFVLSQGEIFAADHPIARKHPHLFAPIVPSRARPAVEQATAAPGERRGRAEKVETETVKTTVTEVPVAGDTEI